MKLNKWLHIWSSILGEHEILYSSNTQTEKDTVSSFTYSE